MTDSGNLQYIGTVDIFIDDVNEAPTAIVTSGRIKILGHNMEVTVTVERFAMNLRLAAFVPDPCAKTYSPFVTQSSNATT